MSDTLLYRNIFPDFEKAVRYAEVRVQVASDWQDVENDLANHDRFGPALEILGDDGLAVAQAIIREAEGRCEARGIELNY